MGTGPTGIVVGIMRIETPAIPGAFYERAAAAYLKIDVADLRSKAADGAIPWTRHPGRTRRIYLRADLDKYLDSLPRCPRDDSPIATGRSFTRED